MAPRMTCQEDHSAGILMGGEPLIRPDAASRSRTEVDVEDHQLAAEDAIRLLDELREARDWNASQPEKRPKHLLEKAAHIIVIFDYADCSHGPSNSRRVSECGRLETR